MLKNILEAWENIVDSDSEETYADSVFKFKKMCVRFRILLNMWGIVLGSVKEKLVRASIDHFY
jgi:hypothetical protein